LFLLLKILNCGTKLQTLCRLSKRFAENLSRAALPTCFSWHSDGRRKALTSRRYPRATAAKKTMQLRYPSKTLYDSCKTPPSPFFTLRTFFFNEGTKILHKNCLPVSSYIVTFVSPNNHLNFTYDEF